MEVKTKKIFNQKVSYDSKSDGIQLKVRAKTKEKKFDEMLERLGEQK